MGCVYEITFPDDSRYVGMTTQSLSERMRGHRKDAKKNLHASSAHINEYGISDDMVRIHFESDDQEFLGLLEYEFIAKRRQEKLNVLNKAEGGLISRGFTKDAEARERISKSKEGLYVGEKNPRALVNENQVRDILQRYHDGEERKILQQEYGLSPSSLGYLIQGKTWKNVERPEGFSNPGRRKLLSDNQVREIRYKISCGIRRKEIAIEYGVSLPTINAIHTRRIYDRVKDE